jgi:small subunit ribosomal protein S1
MSKVLNESATPPSIGDLVEGPVIGIEKSAIYINLPPYGTGIIYGREFIAARDIIKKIGIGDNVGAKVVDTNNADGYIELSLKEAKQAIIWGEAQDAIRDKKIFDLPITEANKGGLIINWQGIQGFLPASQLKAEHYPRVTDGDKDKILEELKKLIGQKIQVSIISAFQKKANLFSLKRIFRKKTKKKLLANTKLVMKSKVKLPASLISVSS